MAYLDRQNDIYPKIILVHVHYKLIQLLLMDIGLGDGVFFNAKLLFISLFTYIINMTKACWKRHIDLKQWILVTNVYR